MVEFMVRLLETGTEALENPAATKAQIVKAIKAMQNSLNYGEQVRFLPKCLQVSRTSAKVHFRWETFVYSFAFTTFQSTIPWCLLWSETLSRSLYR